MRGLSKKAVAIAAGVVILVVAAGVAYAYWTNTGTAPVDYDGLTGGAHSFAVRATDRAGNLSAAATYTWTVDVGLPSINIGFPSGGRSYNDATYAAGCGTPAGDDF
jgi:predicted ribosomally synthesized peptide with SipW-like signal peptide